ncbi:MAG: hypothetical protein KDA78_10805 [Planctomycetaceae bacterium]|nr:hypothetical protein [Planctomycetaceae bacterium]
MDTSELTAKRGIIGFLSLLCFTAFGLMLLYDSSKIAVLGAFMRVGIMLGAFWLAIPLLVRYPRMLKYLPWYVLGGALLIVVFIKQIWMLIPLFIALALLSMFAGPRTRH